MIKLNTVYKAGKQEVKFQEKEPGIIYFEYGHETVEGKMEGNILKAIFHNKKVNVTGLMELTFHETGFDGRWKKGIEPGELKQKWNAVLVEDKNPTNESKNGYHIFTDEDNIRYEGEWKNDEFISGKAEYVDEDGVKVIEDGIFEQGNLKEGKITWADGNTASGTFDEELELNGKGIYTWSNGDFQDGTWVHGEFKDGKAKITHDDGEISEGMMKDGEWMEEIKDVSDSEVPFLNRTFQVGDKVKIPITQLGDSSFGERALKMINNAKIREQDFVYIHSAIASIGSSFKVFYAGDGIPKNAESIVYVLNDSMENEEGTANFNIEDLIFYGEENTNEIKEMTSEEIKSLESSEFNPKEIDLSINLNLPKLKMSDGFEEIIYYGEVEDGFPKGKGVLVFSYDECFFCDDFKEDHFEEGKFVGMENIYEFGSYLFRDSSCLTTFFCGGSCTDGQIIYPDKTKYVGSFEECCWPPKPGGEGCFYDQNDTLIISGVFTNGKFENQNSELIFDNLIDEAPKPIIEENSQYKFVGHKKNNGEIIGFFHGKGSIEYFESGCKYDGEFKDGEKSGKGTYTCPDGQKYEGDFLKGEKYGRGTQKWTNGQRYMGDWIKGKRHGEGKQSWPTEEWKAGPIWQKEGTWENDEFISGKGFWILDGGDTYEGEYSQGAWNGTGKYIWASGDSYEGGFKDGKILGKTKHQLENEQKQREADERRYSEEIARREQEELRHNEEKAKREADELERKKAQEKKKVEEAEEKERKKKQEAEEKSKTRYFEITYNIKLKEDKNQTTYASGFFDAMLNGGMSKTEKTHGKGQLIQRTIRVSHEGHTLSDSSAKNYVVQKDADVKSGKAGTSTITIIKIK
jgi:hypothetical protein